MGEFCGLRRPGIIVRRAGVEKEEGREAGREGGLGGMSWLCSWSQTDWSQVCVGVGR